MRGLRHDGRLFGGILVNLRRFHDLQRAASLGVAHPEGAAAGLALVLHHAAHAQRSVHQVEKFLRRGLLAHLDHQLVLREVDDLAQVHRVHVAALQRPQVGELEALQLRQIRGQHFLVYDRGHDVLVLGDVVDVLHEEDVGVAVVDVVDERAVAAGTEEQPSVLVAEGQVVLRGRQGVGGSGLHGEGDVVFHPETLLIHGLDFRHFRLEELQMVLGDGEVQVGVGAGGGVERGLHEMLLDGGADFVVVAVEKEQTLGQVSVIKSLFLKEILDDEAEVAFLDFGVEVEAFVGHDLLERLVERVAGQGGEEGLRQLLLLVVQVLVQQGVEVLEHAGGGAGRGHELLDFLAFDGVGVFGLQFGHLVLVEAQDAVIHGRGPVDVGEGEALLEVGELLFHLGGVAAALRHKFLIFKVEFQLHNRGFLFAAKIRFF